MKSLLRDIPDAPPALGPYSLGVVAEGRFVFVSGMTPYDPSTGRIERGTVAEQTALVIANIERILKAAGASLGDVVSSRVYLSELNPATFAEMNGVYAKAFGQALPARATIGAQLLGFDVEIECVAVLAC